MQILHHMQENDPSLSYTRRHTDRNVKGLNESLEKLVHEFKVQEFFNLVKNALEAA